MFGQFGQEPLNLPTSTSPSFVDAQDERLVAAGISPKQFWLYELVGGDDCLLDPHSREPELAGSDEKPDAVAAVELESFNFGKDDRDLASGASAALRLDVGPDVQTRTNLDLLYWAATSAIDLGKQLRERKKANELQFKNSDIFKRRPIEIPGGLAKINFEITRHRNPGLFQTILGSLGGDAGKAFMATLGIPGVASSVLEFLNDAISKYTSNNEQAIFQGKFIRFALTQRAKRDFTDGNPNFRLASLRRGRYLITAPEAARQISAAKAVYAGGYGLLAPKADYDRHGDDYDYSTNPLSNLTYGVLRVRTLEAKLGQDVPTP